MMARARALLSRAIDGNVLPQVIFWSFNVVFLAVVFLGLIPVILWDLLRSTIEGPVPWDFTLFSCLVVLIPILCILFAVLFFRRAPRKLLGLFYGIEIPLFLLCLCRLFLVREMTAGVAQLLLMFYVAGFFYLHELLRGYDRRPMAATVLHIGHSILLLCGLYTAALLSFYAPPVFFVLLKEFVALDWLRELAFGLRHTHGTALLLLPLGLLLLIYSALLFIVAPFALLVLSVRSFRRIAGSFAQDFGRARAFLVTAATVATLVLIFLVDNRQPQGAAFALLAQEPTSDAQRHALLEEQAKIRAGLLNAYLSPFRYISAVDENDHIRETYANVFRCNGPLPAKLQDAYNQLARPLLFQGHSMVDDQSKAEELYEHFFDTPIQKGERDAVLRAVEATYSSEQREAGLINQGQQKVWLARQEISCTPHGDFADIELHEIYENKTYEEQEIFYYFSLPESAAVTGLWLGDSDDTNQRFAFVIAPRGAAQKVYRGEVRRRSDPALLEQIGPRQYRLRAFPVPARTTTTKTPRVLHLWLTYKVFATVDGYPLPVLGERRNVYWSGRSKRFIGGKESRFDDRWLPANLPTSLADQLGTCRTSDTSGLEAAPAPAAKKMPAAHEVVLPEGLLVRAQPLSSEGSGIALSLPRDRAIAVVIDRSRSMQRVAEEARSALAYLRDVVAKDRHNDLDFYLTASPYRGEAPSRVDEPAELGASATLFYGAQKTRDLLMQFVQLKKDKLYDLILVLTDDGSLDLADDAPQGQTLLLDAPVFMVHLGGRLAPGYDDATLAAVQKSGGGAVLSVAEALKRFSAASLTLPANGGFAEVASYEDGVLWTVEPTTREAAKPTSGDSDDDSFLTLAARQAILYKTRKAQLGDLAVLDSLHGLAVHYGIVSPYSSMLVLVNDEQRERLKQAAAEKDRFDRQVESGKEILSHPPNPMHISGTPEPQQGLLLVLSAIVLFVARAKRRAAA